MKRRALVLTHEAAGHPFRRSLPHRCFATEPIGSAEDMQAQRYWRMTGKDWRRFLSNYCASLAAITLFFV